MTTPTEVVKKQLSSEEKNILDMSNRVILKGDYGTGKTFLLAEKVKQVFFWRILKASLANPRT